MSSTGVRAGLWRAWVVALVAAAGMAAASLPAAASLEIGGAGQTFTGASYLVPINVSAPESVVLVEWDFDGDGVPDVNRTDALQAGFTYATPGDYTLRVTVTRQTTEGLEAENRTAAVHVADGQPTASIVVPDRQVAGVPLEFRAMATDPDRSPAGEFFAYVWRVDGVPVEATGPVATIVVDEPGAHTVALEVTDEEGLLATTQVTVEFAAPGFFEGRQGVVNLGLLIALVGLAVGLSSVRVAQRERHRARARKGVGETGSAGTQAPASRSKPDKVPFEAAGDAGAPAGGARLVVGGAPAAITRTKECPVCHNAIDAELDPADCPYCRADAEAEALETTLKGAEYADIDLSEVRALLQRAHRERHLGRTDVHSKLVAQARERAEALLGERDAATVWLEKARQAIEHASARTDPERTDRARSYLKLAESLSKAHQHAKVRRHAQRCVELLGEGAAGPDTPDRCHACGGAVAAARAAGAQRCPHCDVALLPDEPEGAEAAAEQEAHVREELHAVRDLLKSGAAAPDEEAWALLREAESFEQEAAWSQALELLRALRERFEREREAAGQDGGGDAGEHTGDDESAHVGDDKGERAGDDEGERAGDDEGEDNVQE